MLKYWAQSHQFECIPYFCDIVDCHELSLSVENRQNHLPIIAMFRSLIFLIPRPPSSLGLQMPFQLTKWSFLLEPPSHKKISLEFFNLLCKLHRHFENRQNTCEDYTTSWIVLISGWCRTRANYRVVWPIIERIEKGEARSYKALQICKKLQHLLFQASHKCWGFLNSSLCQSIYPFICFSWDPFEWDIHCGYQKCSFFNDIR